MAVDDVFEVAAELAIQRHRGATLHENSERFGKQGGTGRVASQQLGNDARNLFDEDFIAIRCTRHESVEIVCRFGTRDVNDRHDSIMPRHRRRSSRFFNGQITQKPQG